MEGKRKIGKKEGMQICVDMMFTGEVRKVIVQHFTDNYKVSISAVEKWMKAARPLVAEKHKLAEALQKEEAETTKHAGGRPRHYDTAGALQAEIDAYFEYIKGEEREIAPKKEGDAVITELVRYPEHPTVTGLAHFLGFESRQSIYDYEKDGQFSYIMKRARLKVEAGYEQRLFSQAPTGAIFALKNMGWKDKVEQEMYGKGGGPIESKHVVEFHDFTDDNHAKDKPAI